MCCIEGNWFEFNDRPCTFERRKTIDIQAWKWTSLWCERRHGEPARRLGRAAMQGEQLETRAASPRTRARLASLEGWLQIVLILANVTGKTRAPKRIWIECERSTWTIWVGHWKYGLRDRESRAKASRHIVYRYFERNCWRLIDNYSTAQVLWGAHVPLGTQILKPLPYMYFRPKSVFDRVIICFHFFTVTNPIDVIKIRMQLENELGSKHSSKNIFKDRYYKGFIRGALRIFSEEGLRGLYKG